MSVKKCSFQWRLTADRYENKRDKTYKICLIFPLWQVFSIAYIEKLQAPNKWKKNRFQLLYKNLSTVIFLTLAICHNAVNN